MAGYVHLAAVGTFQKRLTAARRLSLHPSAFRTQLDTDLWQLGLPRKPCSALPARVPEARWLEDMAEGALFQHEGWSVGKEPGMTRIVASSEDNHRNECI